jgi:NADH:ubiquinone oxidoreductase subunit 2 (subunit N)
MQMNQQLLDNSALKYWFAAGLGTILFLYGIAGHFFRRDTYRSPKSMIDLPEPLEKAIYLAISLGLSIYGFVHIFRGH